MEKAYIYVYSNSQISALMQQNPTTFNKDILGLGMFLYWYYNMGMP